jgi:hypothetical protein
MSDQSAIRFIYITYIYIYITFLFSYLNRYNCAGYWVLTSYFMNNIKTDYGLWIYTTYVILIRGELYSDIFLYEKNDQVIMTPCNEIKDYLSFGVHKSSLAPQCLYQASKVSSQIISLCATEIHFSIVFWNCSESVMFFLKFFLLCHDCKIFKFSFVIIVLFFLIVICIWFHSSPCSILLWFFYDFRLNMLTDWNMK